VRLTLSATITTLSIALMKGHKNKKDSTLDPLQIVGCKFGLQNRGLLRTGFHMEVLICVGPKQATSPFITGTAAVVSSVIPAQAGNQLL
jgi:hypothetical protein